MLVDLLIVAILGLYGYLGYRRGFIAGIGELFAFVIGLAVAFLVYRPLGGFIVGWMHGSRGLADLVGFMAVWTVLELGFSFAWSYGQRRLPTEWVDNPVNRVTGIFPSVIKGLVLIVMLLLIIAVSPIPAAAKTPFTTSTLGKTLLTVGTAFEQQFNNVFGQALRDTLAFKTVKTGSNESSQLGFTEAHPTVCSTDEQRMFQMVNRERRKVGLRALEYNKPLGEVGRAHSADMLERGYFSHNTPEGLDPFQRMERAGIIYENAGENLAFAPTVEIAMSGLMNSPGHRANILKPEFMRIGIGCESAGVRGEMFSQEFGG